MIYDIAGLRMDIRNKYEFTDRFCRAYLSANQCAPVDVVAEVSKEDFLEEKARSEGFSNGYIENICLYRHSAKYRNILNTYLFHNSHNNNLLNYTEYH